MFNKITFLIVLFIYLVACNKTQTKDSTTTTTTLTVSSNQVISGYPHQIDYYFPSNAKYAIIFLHGGGGSKEGVAYSLGIKADSTGSNFSASSSGQDWMISNQVMMVFPQGQTISGTSNAFTWNNYVMNSGQNDVAFLQNLVASIKVNPLYSQITKIYLAGHSNGGMMTNRIWCESPSTFDGYVTLAGPPSSQLSSTGAHPCNPSVYKPYLGIVGDKDMQLQTSGNMSASTWTLSSYNAVSPAWVSSTVLNDKIYYSNRVSAKCAGSPNTPTTSGQLTTYSDCSGSLSFIVVSQITVSGSPSGGDHCLNTPVANCTTTLAGGTGIDYKTTVFNFLKQF